MAPSDPRSINPDGLLPLRQIDPQLDHGGRVEMQRSLDGTARRPERVQPPTLVDHASNRQGSKIHTAGYGRSLR